MNGCESTMKWRNIMDGSDINRKSQFGDTPDCKTWVEPR